jgi:inhibitor of KinA sporulation pathway (predicted exonuclease)
MAVTPERAEEIASIMRGNGVTDEEVRHYVKSLTQKNVDRTPFYEAVLSAFEQERKVSVEDMLVFPSAPKKSDRNTRNKAIKLTQVRLGVSIKREGNLYAIQEDLSEYVSWFITKGNMNKETFETNCRNRRLPPEPMKAAIKKDGRAFFTKHGEMRV